MKYVGLSMYLIAGLCALMGTIAVGVHIARCVAASWEWTPKSINAVAIFSAGWTVVLALLAGSAVGKGKP